MIQTSQAKKLLEFADIKEALDSGDSYLSFKAEELRRVPWVAMLKGGLPYYPPVVMEAWKERHKQEELAYSTRGIWRG